MMFTAFSRFHRLNRLSLRLIVIMAVIILIAETVILIPSLSRFHDTEMLIEPRRQLYLHQVAILHGNKVWQVKSALMKAGLGSPSKIRPAIRLLLILMRLIPRQCPMMPRKAEPC